MGSASLAISSPNHVQTTDRFLATHRHHLGHIPNGRTVRGREPETWWTKPENHVGNGPFKITEIDAGNKIILAANPNYWQGKPKLD